MVLNFQEKKKRQRRLLLWVLSFLTMGALISTVAQVPGGIEGRIRWLMTDNRTIIFPDDNGTMVLAGNCSVGQFVNGVNGTGGLQCASSGSGTVTSISQGTGMLFSVDPIVTTGTINLAEALTGTIGGVRVANCTASTQKVTGWGVTNIPTCTSDNDNQSLQSVTSFGSTTTDNVTIDSDGNGNTTIGGNLTINGNLTVRQNIIGRIPRVIVNDNVEVTTTSTTSVVLKTYTNINFTTTKIFDIKIFFEQDASGTTSLTKLNLRLSDGISDTDTQNFQSNNNVNLKIGIMHFIVFQENSGTTTQIQVLENMAGNSGTFTSTGRSWHGHEILTLTGGTNFIDQNTIIVMGGISAAGGGTLRVNRVVIEEIDEAGYG